MLSLNGFSIYHIKEQPATVICYSPHRMKKAYIVDTLQMERRSAASAKQHDNFQFNYYQYQINYAAYDVFIDSKNVVKMLSIAGAATAGTVLLIALLACHCRRAKKLSTQKEKQKNQMVQSIRSMKQRKNQDIIFNYKPMQNEASMAVNISQATAGQCKTPPEDTEQRTSGVIEMQQSNDKI